jgi:hypothetical protein
MVEKKEEEQTQEKDTNKKKPSKALVITLSIVAGIVVVYGVGSTIFRATQKSKVKLAEKAIEESIKQSSQAVVDVEIKDEGEEISIETEEGKITTGSQELPDNFPEDIPIYKDATIMSTAASGNGSVVVLKATDSLKEATSFYSEELEKNGWTIESTTEIANATIYTIEKGDLFGGVIINGSDEGIQITLEISRDDE